jgi:NADPH2:quinone reductase
MKAIQVSQVGGPRVLTLVDFPFPSKANEAVVQIKAAGVNFIDVYFRAGRYQSHGYCQLKLTKRRRRVRDVNCR